jgi:SH3-like domain-containing protein
VRNAAQEEGWIEQKYVVDEGVNRAVEKLASDNRKALVQGHASADTDLRMRVEPQRDADFLYMLKEKDKVKLLKRASTEKPNKQPLPIEQPKNAKPLEPVYEDWWLVRNADGRVGWVVARNLDVEVPMEVAEYAEGRKIVAWFKLNEVHRTKEKDSKMVPQYLMALSDPKGGLPYDFDQIRVFTWNQKKERYETAYRERLIGDLPIQVATQDLGKDGLLPVFTLRAKESDQPFQERKYSLNGVMVRRVLAPGETPPAKAKHPRR